MFNALSKKNYITWLLKYKVKNQGYMLFPKPKILFLNDKFGKIFESGYYSHTGFNFSFQKLGLQLIYSKIR